jgi:hypothetical protein
MHFSKTRSLFFGFGAVINGLGDKKLMYFRNGYRYKNKQLENSMETRKIYLEIFDICSITCSANVNAVFKFFPCTLQLRLIDVVYGL